MIDASARRRATALAVAIVDDEPLARHRLRRLLGKVGAHALEIVLECVDAEELLSAARGLELDVVFLDIEMPGGDAFEVLRCWQGRRPDIVFVTAHESYGVRAFDARVVDYLLKPVSAERLRETIDRLCLRAALGIQQLREDAARRVPLQIGQRTHLVGLDEIDAVVAQGNYIDVHSGGNTYAVRRSLASFESELDAALFARLHRSLIVRISAIREIHSVGSGRYRLELHGGRRFQSGRSYRQQVRQLMR